MIGHRGGGTAEIRGRQEGDRVGTKRIMITLAPIALTKCAVNVKK